MLCQHCQQKPASVHVTQIINNEKKEIHLCEQCAREHDKFAITGSAFNFVNPLSINDFLAGFLGKDFSQHIKPQEKTNMPVCNTCGMTHEQFARSGKLGCANCYDVFASTLHPVFKRIHGNVLHNGKLPQRAGGAIKVKREIEKLRIELSEAIQAEEYERAAQIRDEIRNLESGMKGEE